MIACIVGFWAFQNFYTPATYSNTDGTTDPEPIAPYFLPSSTTGDIISHNYYTLSYNEPFEQAEWVAYVLKKGHLTADDRKRPYFIEDPKVKSKSADWRNYKGSGYDRGHFCPAGDRRFSEQAYNETFYTSNISPQDRAFNAGIWNRLEQRIRLWARNYGSVFVVTGGVLENGLKEIGVEDVAVPNYYYKIVAKGDADDMEVIAFLMEGKESARPLQEFTVSVDEIERRTGIDFFEKLPTAIQQKLEKEVDSKGWKF
ncbi:DNA/RNA non-specific endonuclease [Aggregatimonas sangjinii]|uniref:DNA/RNA non-specific endonuclease n=1 Tax=Aggregatimonas sangjinii TaxID=2583587 RepID=A0A5B7SYT1_9FLAO|nr:DNA/RNA non-specific endonuclease [Aggregatimonas sangjinii]QCX02238.1 DNA/RNA non-specific endonuclease [Aggregatimonas sangjinii]